MTATVASNACGSAIARNVGRRHKGTPLAPFDTARNRADPTRPRRRRQSGSWRRFVAFVGPAWTRVRDELDRIARAIRNWAVPGTACSKARESQSTRKVCEPSLNTMSANSARAVPCWKLLTAISHTLTIRAGGGPIAARTSAWTWRSSAHQWPRRSFPERTTKCVSRAVHALIGQWK